MRIRVSDLAPGQQYALQFRSLAGDGFSGWSQKLVVNTDIDPTAPAIVTGVNLVADGTAFVATWNAVTTNADGSAIKDFDHYRVQITDGTVAIEKHSTVPSFSILFEDNNAWFGTPKATLTINVWAVDTTGNQSAAPGTDTESNPAPAAPTNLVPTAYTDQIVFKWDASTSDDVVAYRVHFGTSSGFVANAGNLVWAGAALTASYFSSDTATDKYFKIYSVDVFGTLSATPLSAGPLKPLGVAGTTDTTPPAAPTGVTATVLNTAGAVDPSGQFVDVKIAWTGPTPASDSSLQNFIVRYSFDAVNWNYVTVDRDELQVVLNRVPAGGNMWTQVRSIDFTANDSAWMNASTYPLPIAKDTVGPSVPAAPSAATGSMQVQVSHNLTKSGGGAMESDLDFFEVFASTTSGFAINDTPVTGNMIGTMKVIGSVAVQTFKLPAVATSGSGIDSTSQKWYVRVRAVDRSGNRSAAASPETQAQVDLILTANIGKATITSAEIQEVNVGKLSAGVIDAIGDITARSRIIIGDATNSGDLRSYGYVSATTGFKLDKTGLEINDGSISAKALKIQDSPNLMPVHYAGFEYSTGFYTQANAVYGPSATITLDTVNPKFEAQSLKIAFTGGPVDQGVDFAPDRTTYNVPVEPGDYIYSIWVRNNGSTAHTVWLGCRSDQDVDLAISGGNNTTTVPTGGTWVQRYGKFTVPAGVRKVRMSVFTVGQTTVDYNIDGVMVERQTSATLIPSAWKPPGITRISGGLIETQSIQTESLGVGAVKADNIDSEAIQTRHLESDLVVSKKVIAMDPDLTVSNRVELGLEGLVFWQYQPEDGSYLDTITLPTDIEGTATFRGSVITEEISILNGATLRGSQNELARGAALVMSGNTTKPSAAPNYSFVYEQYNLGLLSTETPYGLCPDGGGYTTYAYNTATSTGGFVNYNTSTGVLDRSWTKNDGYRPEGGIIHDPVWGKFVALSKKISDGSWYLEVYNSNKTLSQRVLFYDSFSVNTYHNFTIGYDHTTDKILVMGADVVNSVVKIWSMNFTNGIAPNVAGATITTGNYSFHHKIGYVGISAFDIGATRVVYRSADDVSKWQVRNTTLATNYTTDQGWDGAGTELTQGAWWNGANFWAISSTGTLTKYEGGTHYWDSTAQPNIWFVGNTYRDENPLYAEGSSAAHSTANGGGAHATCGGIHETDIGTITSFTMRKRAQLKVTGNALPNYNLTNDPAYPNGLGADDPNGYGFFLGRPSTPTGTTVTNSLMKLISRPGAGVLSVTVTNFNFAKTANAGTVTNTFPIAPPASIKSGALDVSGAPLLELRADGYAKLNQLIVNSTADASRAADNTPALRVGSITGSHLRIDGDEIMKMNSNTVDDQGLLTLNQSLRDVNDVSIAGGVRLSRGGIIRAWNMGFDTKSTNANSEIFIPHALGETPTSAVVTPQNSNIHASITGLGPVNITCVLRQISNGALDPQGNSRLVYWQAAVVA